MPQYTITAICGLETATTVVDIPDLTGTLTVTQVADLDMSAAISGLSDDATVTVDWGDGTAPESVTLSGGAGTATHTYADTTGSPYTVTVTGDTTGAVLTDTITLQTATVVLSGDGRIEAMVHAGADPYTLTMTMPNGTPSPPATLNVTGPNDFTYTGEGNAGDVLTVTAPADGDYTVTDPRTGDSDTFTIPTTVAEGTQLGGVRVGYWIRAESDAASQFDVGYHAEDIDPAADPTDGSITPGGAMQWRSLDGQTPTIHFTDPAGVETVVTIAAGDAAQNITLVYSPAGA